jgi:hypothetical protein
MDLDLTSEQHKMLLRLRWHYVVPQEAESDVLVFLSMHRHRRIFDLLMAARGRLHECFSHTATLELRPAAGPRVGAAPAPLRGRDVAWRYQGGAEADGPIQTHLGQ